MKEQGDFIERIQNNKTWKKDNFHKTNGGYVEYFSADNGDKIELRTIGDSVYSKYFIDGELQEIDWNTEELIYFMFW